MDLIPLHIANFVIEEGLGGSVEHLDWYRCYAYLAQAATERRNKGKIHGKTVEELDDFIQNLSADSYLEGLDYPEFLAALLAGAAWWGEWTSRAVGISDYQRKFTSEPFISEERL